MREYKIAKGWAILIYIGGPLLIGLFGWLIIMPFVSGTKDDLSTNAYWILAPISIGMIVLIVIGIIDAVKAKFVIDHDQIYTKSTFSNRQLMFNEIKGYRVTDKYIFVESNVERKKTIKISTYLEKTNEITSWLASYYPDLDLLNAEKEEQEILSNEELGFTSEQREEKLNKARRTVKIINWCGGLAGAWVLFWPKPYEYAIIVCIAIPLISMTVLKFSNGLIHIEERNDSAYPTIFWAIFASSMGLFLRALLDYNIFTYDNIWMPSVLIALGFIAVMLVGNKEFKFKRAMDFLTIFGVSMLLWAYAYGAVVSLNCFYDESKPEIFNSKIVNKRVSSGKYTTYYFELSPWGQQKEIEEVSVPIDLYNQLDKDDNVTIYFRKGQFEIPWFTVTE